MVNRKETIAEQKAKRTRHPGLDRSQASAGDEVMWDGERVMINGADECGDSPDLSLPGPSNYVEDINAGVPTTSDPPSDWWSLVPIETAQQESIQVNPFSTTDMVAFHNLRSPSLDRQSEDLWRTIFGDIPLPTLDPFSPFQSFIPPAITPPMLFESAPSLNESSDIQYLHHYLNVVLPLQYRFSTRVMSDYLAPLALSRPSVLGAVSALAALHMAAYRTKRLAPLDDRDVQFAKGAYEKVMDTLRIIPVDDFRNEDVIVSAMFATSFHAFSGGTEKGWREATAVCQRCLEALLDINQSLSSSG
jgi:hypothetical protein